MGNILNDIEKRLFNLTKISVLLEFEKDNDWANIGKFAVKFDALEIIDRLNQLKLINNMDTVGFISLIDEKYIKPFRPQAEQLEVIIENEGVNYSNEFINNSTDRQRIILSIVTQYYELEEFILHAEKDTSTKTGIETPPKEQHTHIFKNNGFKLFEYLMNNYVVKNKGRNSDIIYFYWKMYDSKGRTQYIHVKSTPFRKWLEDESEYKDSIIDWKTLDEVTTKDNKRHNSYTTALDWFKGQK